MPLLENESYAFDLGWQEGSKPPGAANPQCPFRDWEAMQEFELGFSMGNSLSWRNKNWYRYPELGP